MLAYIAAMCDFMMKKFTVVFAVFVCALMLLLPSTVEAQKKKTIVIEEIKIEGTIQKPEVMTFLSRARFTYRSLELNVSFINKVEEVILSEDAF